MNKLQRDSHIFSLAMSKVYDFSFALCGFLQKVSLLKKLFLLYNFFFARRIISHNVTFFFYCIIIPLSSFFPEVTIPKWGVFYIPTVITILNSIGTPRFDTSHKFIFTQPWPNGRFLSSSWSGSIFTGLYISLSSGYFSRTSCPCIDARLSSSVYLKQGEWMSGSSQRN